MSAETIYCSHCGAPNEAGANFCYRCGTKLTVPRPTAAGGETGSGEPTASSSPSEPAPPPPAGNTGWPVPPPSGRFGARTEEPVQNQAPPPPATPPIASWSGRSQTDPPPVPQVAATTARYVVLAGIGLLTLSCLWVFLAAVGTHLSAPFGIFCLAPIGTIVLVVGLFLMLSRRTGRQS